MKEVVILCGGPGERLGELTTEIPKSLVKVLDKELIKWQLDWLRKYGYNKFIFACGYKWEMIKELLGESEEFIYSPDPEDKKLGTLGALSQALKYIENEEFLVVNGDVVTDLNLEEFEKAGRSSSNPTILTVAYENPYGIVKENKIIEKPKDHINASVYWFKKEQIPKTIEGKQYIERHMLAPITLNEFFYDGPWISVENKEHLKIAENIVKD